MVRLSALVASTRPWCYLALGHLLRSLQVVDGLCLGAVRAARGFVASAAAQNHVRTEQLFAVIRAQRDTVESARRPPEHGPPAPFAPLWLGQPPARPCRSLCNRRRFPYELPPVAPDWSATRSVATGSA
jgi:hypothetical protein